MSLLFVSDLHLEDQRPDITRALFHLLAQKRGEITQLFLLGDIFEVWLGDDTPSACADDLARQLKSLADDGIGIFLMHGNRDFLLGDAYADRCGATLIDEPYPLKVAGHNAILLHGDALCTRDAEYIAFRRMVRNPSWIEDFLSKPLPERIAIGRSLREKSQESAMTKQQAIMDVTPDEVVAMMESHSADLMIHGHTHRPAVHNLQLRDGAGVRVVLGDWYQQGWYLEADDRQYSLKPFPFPQA